MSPRIVDRREKTSLIVRKATEVFAEKGYNIATMSEIAERADIGKGTIYEYFGSKKDLFFAVFDQYIQGMGDVVRSRVADPAKTAANQLHELTEGVLITFEDARRLFPLVFEFWAASASPQLRRRTATMFRKTYSTFRNIVAKVVRHGIARGEFDPHVDPEAVSAVLVGSLDGLFLQAWFDEKLDLVRLGRSFIETLLQGLVITSGDEVTRARGSKGRKE
jgi:AcrR family transcriptional regulator